MKQVYLSIMELALNAYSDEHIRTYFQSVQRDGLKEHGFPRLTANMGILIAHGKRTELFPLFLQMMDLCCDQIPKAPAGNVGNDFSVKEILFAIREVEKARLVSEERIGMWKGQLAEFDPYKGYNEIAPAPDVRVANWAAYNLASEFMRQHEGLCDGEDFLNLQIPSQLLSFDENGMYRDPHEPMLYDLASRCQLAVLLHFDYQGKFRAEIDENLKKGGLLTLKMQSVLGQIPFGGRSNQFLFNEAYLASVFEFEATRYARLGDLELAGQFKRAAHLAAEAILPWLQPGREKHMKNRYPKDSTYGCEGYGYFNKYMISLASFIYLAYLFADDSVEEGICPAEAGGFIAKTSDDFHKVFCNQAGYFLEFDWAADGRYDGSGLGRIHKAGAPAAICLSVPFTKRPMYNVDGENPGQLSLCCGLKGENGWEIAAEHPMGLTQEQLTEKEANVVFDCALPSGHVLQECSVSGDGVELRAVGKGDVCIMLPLFAFDGREETEITVSGQNVTVRYEGWSCRYTTDGTLVNTGDIYYNRSGRYLAYRAEGRDTVSVRIQIEK